MIDLNKYMSSISSIADGIFVTESPSQASFPEAAQDVLNSISKSSFWFNHRNKCILEVLNHFPPNDILFDIGGGNGIVSRYLRSAGVKSILVEPSRQACFNAKNKGLSPIICSSLEKAGFFSNTLPSVGLFDVIEHLEDDIQILSDISILLKPGGRLYLTVPAYQCLWSEDDEYAGHYRRYSVRRVSTALNSVGFTIDFTTHFFTALILPIYIIRTLPHKLGIKRNITAANITNDHTLSGQHWDGLLKLIHSFELRKIRKLKSIPFGSSILISAHLN